MRANYFVVNDEMVEIGGRVAVMLTLHLKRSQLRSADIEAPPMLMVLCWSDLNPALLQYDTNPIEIPIEIKNNRVDMGNELTRDSLRELKAVRLTYEVRYRVIENL